MKKFRLFFNPIEGRKKWLNQQVAQGMRLKKPGRFFYTFEKTSESYAYDVQYIGYMANSKRKDYEAFLQELNLQHWSAPINQGKFSLGAVRFRPYARGMGKLATAPGMINKEILIVEKHTADQSFAIFNDRESSLENLRERRKPYLYTGIFMLVFILCMILSPSMEASLAPWVMIILGAFIAYCCYFIVFLGGQIRQLTEKNDA